MAFFKKYNGTQDRALLRLEGLTWVFIYGGLLTLVLAYFMHQQGSPAHRLFLGGSVSTAVGVVLIYVRSRVSERG